MVDQYSSLCWNAPPRGYIKINCDAAFNIHSGLTGIAPVAVDDNKVVTGGFFDFIEDCSSVIEAEVRNFALALSLATQLGAPHVVFESDSVNVLHIFFGHIHCSSRTGSILN